MIDILLPTYNGEKYLSTQLESIFQQTYHDWKIIIRDDGSSDGTLHIIEKWRQDHPHKIFFMDDGFSGLGASKSFCRLMEYSTASYIMLCDQDDYWYPHKIEVSMAAILEKENQYGIEKPLMVCSDLEVVDENLDLVSKSFWHDRKDNPSILNDFEKLIAQSVVTGNTILMNRASKEISIPINSNFFLHDQWISIKVARYGEIIFINKKLVKYRQHSSNALGSFVLNRKYLIKKINSIPYYIKSWIKLKSELNMEFSISKIVIFKLSYNFKKLI